MIPTELTDDEILERLKKHDEAVTRLFFYDYCRTAYYMYNRYYDLDSKPGMDFYSLAHEYYLALDNHEWRQMEDRKPGTSLKSWMIGGFRFLVLDKLKQSEYERLNTDIEWSSNNRRIEFGSNDSTFNEDVRKTIEEVANAYYGRDSKASIILKLLLVDGYSGKEVARMLDISPSAVSQRYQKMMRDVIAPYFRHNYTPSYDAVGGAYYATPPIGADMAEAEISYRIGRPAHEESASEKPRHSFLSRLFSRFGADNDDTNITEQTPYDMKKDINQRVTPDYIEQLEPGEIFVFGSNLSGMHGGGAARLAFQRFGAIMGRGVGLQGQSYGIPTMQGGTETIKPYVDEFILFAEAHPELRFLVTRIGCGIAGFSPEEIAPLFAQATEVENICLPADFWTELV